MHSFRNGRLARLSVPLGTTWLMNDISEAKGRQQLHTRQAPQVLKALRDAAMVESAESSNRIEGVTVDSARLRPLVLGNAVPRDRPEQEVMGYRRALDEIHHRHARLPVTPDTLLQLHALAQAGGGDAGRFKTTDNDILQLLPDAPPVVRFRCLPAAQTPAAIDELCLLYRHSLDQDHVPPLLAIAALVLDFLCIHPFRDGNGRVSRLLTLLALYHHGYEVGRYISLERLVEQSREDYYENLHRSSQRWHAGRHDPLPWFNFQLAVIRNACHEFEQRAGRQKSPRGGKTLLVEQALRQSAVPLGIAELESLCPGVSRDMIRTVLRNLKSRSLAECHGRGPGARWANKGIIHE